MVLRVLIGVAAVAMIVGVGVFLWDRHQAQAAVEAAAEKARCEPILADWDRIKAGLPRTEAYSPAVALSLMSGCGYRATEEDRRAAGLK